MFLFSQFLYNPYDYQTLILESANPANNFLPVEFQQIAVTDEYLTSFFSD